MQRVFFTAIFVFTVLTVSVHTQEIDSLVITTEDAELAIGDSLQFEAALFDTSGAAVDTTIVWNIISLENVGTVDDAGLFIAENAGNGVIVASFNAFADSAFVKVEGDEPAPPADEVVIEAVEIVEDSVETRVGESVELTAVVRDSSDSQADTSVTWSVAAETDIGTIDDEGIFTAAAVGTGLILASIGDLSDSITVVVEEALDPIAAEINVKPQNSTIAVGDSISFESEILDANGDELEVVVSWSVSDSTLGSINPDGTFIALADGELTVTVSFEDTVGEAEVTISDKPVDPGNGGQVRNTIRIMREFQGIKTQFRSGKDQEGDTIQIAGFASPLNFINGTKIVFPDSCLGEDITITMKIQKIGKINLSTMHVDFPDSIMGGVTFEVSVNDSVVHPYHFNEPLEVTIPYRQALLDKIGITPDQISMYYMNEAGELVAEGITDIVLDKENKLITGKVEHFSDVVLATSQDMTVGVADGGPDGFSLSTNYPNPFNPSTTIPFAVPDRLNVTIKVYNLLGQYVTTLTDSVRPAGSYSVVWDGKNDAGMMVTSGIYFYRLEAGIYSETRRMVFMR